MLPYMSQSDYFVCIWMDTYMSLAFDQQQTYDVRSKGYIHDNIMFVSFIGRVLVLSLWLLNYNYVYELGGFWLDLMKSENCQNQK